MSYNAHLVFKDLFKFKIKIQEYIILKHCLIFLEIKRRLS